MLETNKKKQIIVDYPAVSELLRNIPDNLWLDCRFLNVKRGNILFSHGDTVEYIYIICKGIIEISSNSLSGNETKVVFVTEGNIIGEMEALAQEETLVYNAKAYTDSILIKVPVYAFLDWISKDIYIARFMAVSLAKKLHESSMETIKYSQHSALIRLVGVLYAEDHGVILKTRQQLSETCGVSTRTISRCINKLKEKNLVSIHKGKIKISKEQKDRMGHMYYSYLKKNTDY